MRDVIKLIEKHVSERQIDRHQGLNVLCDFLIDLFDYRHYLTPDGWVKNLIKQEQQEPHLFKIAMIWMEKVSDAMERGSWLDFFGGVYEEMYQSRGKASTLGQFFTPPHLCDAMARMLVCDGGKINDSACGSGRTLLAAWAEANRRGEKGIKGYEGIRSYYVGEDIDTASVKMCALNLMIHGMRGRAVRHDTLKEPVGFDYGFEVNEVRYPMPVPFYSLRRIRVEKGFNEVKDDKEFRDEGAKRAEKVERASREEMSTMAKRAKRAEMATKAEKVERDMGSMQLELF